MEKIVIRQLTRKDRKYITGMIKRLSERLGPEGISDLINADFVEAARDASKEQVTSKLVNVMVNILNKLIENFETEMETFFVSILSLPGEEPFTVDRLDALPVGADLEIILAIVESEEGKDFFSNALRLRNLISGWSEKLKPEKTG